MLVFESGTFLIPSLGVRIHQKLSEPRPGNPEKLASENVDVTSPRHFESTFHSQGSTNGHSSTERLSDSSRELGALREGLRGAPSQEPHLQLEVLIPAHARLGSNSRPHSPFSPNLLFHI